MKKWELFIRPEFEEVVKEAVRRLGKENDILISSTDLPFELGEEVI